MLQKFPNEPQCCCFDIRVGALIAAIVYIVADAIGGIGGIVSYDFLDFGFGIASVIVLIPCICVIIAVLKNKSFLYLPFLIINAVSIGGTIIGGGIVVISFLALAFGGTYFLNEFDKGSAIANLGTGLVILFFILAVIIYITTVGILIWMYSVVFRAYNYTKNVIERSNHPTGVSVATGNSVYPIYNSYSYPAQGQPYAGQPQTQQSSFQQNYPQNYPQQQGYPQPQVGVAQYSYPPDANMPKLNGTIDPPNEYPELPPKDYVVP